MLGHTIMFLQATDRPSEHLTSIYQTFMWLVGLLNAIQLFLQALSRPLRHCISIVLYCSSIYEPHCFWLEFSEKYLIFRVPLAYHTQL